uniref:Uncharacterized protein n=1 Tax=viral metagenome TaxID=1070528 RepID=A0A6C0LT47_9ZZZZ
MNNVNVLFYSNHCEPSRLLLSMMNNENITRFFFLICTDNNKNIPPQITITPTIVIRGVSSPYIAGDAFVWLSKIKQWKVHRNLQKMSTMQQKYITDMNSNLVGDNIYHGFSKEEMNGMSDMFAYLSTDEAIQHSYFDYSKIGQENIITPPNEDEKFLRINENKHKQLKNILESERYKQDEAFKQTIENFKKVVNNNPDIYLK